MNRLGYRPALDGLRAIAIGLVVAVHLGWLSGGYLGVDLFFVLSGFLITRLLIEEHAATGRMSLRRFYERRARRLLPALLVLLAVYSTVALVRGKNPTAPTLEGIFYCTNFFLAFAGQSSPVQHLWSLAEEEQFYLLWPLLLIVLLRFRPRWVGPILVGAFAILSVHAVVLVLHGANGVRLDYSPDTRSDGLIVGCLLAVWWHPRPRSMLRSVAFFGTPLAALALVELTPADPLLHFGLLPIIVIYFAALVELALADGRFARALSARPLAYTGRISYSLYLWHVPIFAALGVGTATVPVRIAGLAASLAAAAASYHFVERPFLRRSRPISREGSSPEPIPCELGANFSPLLAAK